MSQYQSASGNQLTSEMLADAPDDPLKICIVQLIEAMRTDYAQSFKKIFKTDEELRQYKRRLYGKFRTMPVDRIYEAYDLFVDKGRRFPPEVPELLILAAEVDASRKLEEKNARQAEAMSALPGKVESRLEDALAMLASAKAKIKTTIRESDDERKKRLEKLADEHDELLRRAGKLSVRAKADFKPCAFFGCANAGVISHATHGGGNFYCGEHWQRTA